MDDISARIERIEAAFPTKEAAAEFIGLSVNHLRDVRDGKRDPKEHTEAAVKEAFDALRNEHQIGLSACIAAYQALDCWPAKASAGGPKAA